MHAEASQILRTWMGAPPTMGGATSTMGGAFSIGGAFPCPADAAAVKVGSHACSVSGSICVCSEPHASVVWETQRLSLHILHPATFATYHAPSDFRYISCIQRLSLHILHPAKFATHAAPNMLPFTCVPHTVHA